MKSLRPERAHGFAAEFVSNGFNATRAVIACGITNKPTSAQVIGHRLLCNVKTREAIKEHMQDAKMNADEVLERLSKIARTDAEFKGSDVVKANELIGKGHKLFTDKIESVNTNTSTVDSSQLLRTIDRISSKSGRNQRDIAESFLQEFSDRSDPDYNPDLEAAIVQIIANMPVTEQIEQITEIGDQ